MMRKIFTKAIPGIILSLSLFAFSCTGGAEPGPLPRSTPEKEKFDAAAVGAYLEAVEESVQDLHSLMILRNGKVIAEHWLGDNAPDKPHIMNSVSKTYTATAIGFAVDEGLISVNDKVISFFPDKLPEEAGPYLEELEVRHLLTMSVGHERDPLYAMRNNDDIKDWVAYFLALPIVDRPGSQFMYNSGATFMLSAILQEVTGEKLVDYLGPRLFEPLGIENPHWEDNPQGITSGGWGLYVKTEDMAKLGQFLLQKGKWNGKQLLSREWVDEMTRKHIESLPAGVKKEDIKFSADESDWLQGYGYQMWMCRYGAVRADGANGQFIVLLPDKNAVVVLTAHVGNMQAEINLVWEHLLPAFK